MPQKFTVTSAIKASLAEGLGYKDVKKAVSAMVSMGVISPIDERVNTQRAFELRRQGMSWENVAKDQGIRKTNIESATKFAYPFLVERKMSKNVLQTLEQRTMQSHGFESMDEYNEYMQDAY